MTGGNRRDGIDTRRTQMRRTSESMARRERWATGLLAGALAATTLLAAPEAVSAGAVGSALPEAWSGTWEVAVSYRDPLSGELRATDVTETAICPGQSLLPEASAELVHCAGDGGDELLDLRCHARVAPRPGCEVFVEVELWSERRGDAWDGAGSWNVKVVGSCEHRELGEGFELTARRLGEPPRCAGAPASFGRAIFSRLGIIPLLVDRRP
jgi:hypothetical protein